MLVNSLAKLQCNTQVYNIMYTYPASSNGRMFFTLATIKQLAEVKETYRRLLETNVKTQQELNELEVINYHTSSSLMSI